MFSTRPLVSKSSRTLVTIPSAPITTGINVTFMSLCVFCSLVRSTYLSLFSLSFNFTLWSTETIKSTIRQVLFIWLSLGLIVCVTLCEWSAKQTIPLSVLARNQTEAWARNLRPDRKWVRERERAGWTKELIEGSWRRARQSGSWQSTSDCRRDQSAWNRVQQQWGKTSQDESVPLVVCRIFARNTR